MFASTVLFIALSEFIVVELKLNVEYRLKYLVFSSDIESPTLENETAEYPVTRSCTP